MRVGNGESKSKCAFPGSDCPNEVLTGQTMCQMHIGSDPAKIIAERREAIQVQRRARTESAPIDTSIDPVVAGARRAQQLVAEESQARLEFFKRQQDRSGRPLKSGTFRAFQRPVRKDQTEMRHPVTGENLVKPGWAARWLRKTDSQGRPSAERAEEWRAWGGEPVTYRDGDGAEKPLEGHMGVAFQLPPEQYAGRIADHTPVGAYNRFDLLEDTEAAVDDLNRRAGTRAASLTVEAEHRSQRVEVAPGERIIDQH